MSISPDDISAVKVAFFMCYDGSKAKTVLMKWEYYQMHFFNHVNKIIFEKSPYGQGGPDGMHAIVWHEEAFLWCQGGTMLQVSRYACQPIGLFPSYFH